MVRNMVTQMEHRHLASSNLSRNLVIHQIRSHGLVSDSVHDAKKMKSDV